MTNYTKNRNKLIQDMINEYGYVFCRHCGKSRAFKFEMHHIIYRSEKPNHPQIHNPRNLIILCNDCHRKFHNHKSIRSELVTERKLNKLFK